MIKYHGSESSLSSHTNFKPLRLELSLPTSRQEFEQSWPASTRHDGAGKQLRREKEPHFGWCNGTRCYLDIGCHVVLVG